MRPGVFEVRARLAWVSVFSALDLPALERPAKATSKPSSSGHWSTLAALSMNVDCWHRPRMGFLSCMRFPMWAMPRKGAASGVVSVSVAPVYNAADFVCALSQRRMKFTGAKDLYCALERKTLSNPEMVDV